MADEIKPKKSIWKRWWIWVIIVFVIIIVAAASGGDRERDLEPETTAPEQKVSEEKPEEKIESTTLGERNALRAAKHYLDTMPFSYSGLIKQLGFEGYSEQEAKYGADHCGADWNEQAAKAAKHYLDTMPFSRSDLIKQLEFEGYTSEQAEYGVSVVGY